MTRTAIFNVRVFDGTALTEPGTVVLDGPVFGLGTDGAEVLDAEGATLLPGLIDTHVHLGGEDTLRQLARHGVTTALDMASWPPEKVTALRDRPGVTDIRSAGLPAIGPGGVHAKVLGLPPEAVVLTPEQAEEFVRARVAERVDYVKVVLEEPGAGGPDEETARALVRAAHAAGLKVVAHAASVGAYALAAEVGPDVVTHLPFDGVVREQDVAALAGAGQVVSTTLTMGLAMRGPEALEVMAPSVLALHRAGVPLLAGTDAHDQGALPGVRHGKSLLQELELLARCGLSPVEVLRAATWEPARHFGLLDRGAIRPGLRADAVLVAGDPVQDITTVHNVQKVWCAGQLVN